ncbi:hypothetical protein ACQJBY_020337 [Aegilops geniculata]
MERPPSYHASSAALLLALLLCCSLVCSAAAPPVFLEGDHDGQSPPAPFPSRHRKTDCPGCGHMGTSARRKTSEVAANVDPSA